jgi:hypothetical protein
VEGAREGATVKADKGGTATVMVEGKKVEGKKMVEGTHNVPSSKTHPPHFPYPSDRAIPGDSRR